MATQLAPGRDDRAAIDKAFSLLVAFGADGCGEVGVSELARRTGMSKSTAFRVLGMLERNLVVERVGTGYRLGARLHELGRAYSPRQDRIRDLLLPYLAELFELTHQTVHLAVLDGFDVLYLAKLYGHRTVGAPSRIGERLPANCTAVGKSLLAYSPIAATKILATPLRGLTEHSVTSSEELAAQLSGIRRNGLAVECQESRVGVQCVAAPVVARKGPPWAAMSVSAPTGSDMRTAVAALRRICASAAAGVQRGIGDRSA